MNIWSLEITVGPSTRTIGHPIAERTVGRRVAVGRTITVWLLTTYTIVLENREGNKSPVRQEWNSDSFGHLDLTTPNPALSTQHPAETPTPNV